jgi:hypothetical protein
MATNEKVVLAYSDCCSVRAVFGILKDVEKAKSPYGC